MKVLAVIPARYASSRLPGKPLIRLAGRTMIERVHEQVSRASRVDRIVVATDDERIHAHVTEFGGESIMTSPDHPSGTDRIAEATRLLGGAEIIINIQGDEPTIAPLLIDCMIEALDATGHGCATPVSRIMTAEELLDPNVVKVAMRADFTPLYFSRSPIPYLRGSDPRQWPGLAPFYRHIGLYAYRRDALEKFVAAPPSALETCEQLEQLRMFELGISMICIPTDYQGLAVDTPEDAARAHTILSESASGTR